MTIRDICLPRHSKALCEDEDTNRWKKFDKPEIFPAVAIKSDNCDLMPQSLQINQLFMCNGISFVALWALTVNLVEQEINVNPLATSPSYSRNFLPTCSACNQFTGMMWQNLLKPHMLVICLSLECKNTITEWLMDGSSALWMSKTLWWHKGKARRTGTQLFVTAVLMVNVPSWSLSWWVHN